MVAKQLIQVLTALSLLLGATTVHAAPPTTCKRPPAGGVVSSPPDLYSKNGALDLTLNYITSVDADGRDLYCFVTPDGLESPTLHVRPGDMLNIHLNDNLPPPAPDAAPVMDMSAMTPAPGQKPCTDVMADASSVNMHFHGTNTSPRCHSDEVITTVLNSGQSYDYHVMFPSNEPPGLYWYHPHIHGLAEASVQGGASGAIVVEGIQNVQPAVAGLPSRVLVIRDQTVAGEPTPGGKIPSWDVSVNYVPIAYPALKPAIIPLTGRPREFWRVANASADTILDLRVTYDGVNQPIEIVGLDGVPTGSQDGTGPGRIVAATHVLLPPAGRAEFIMAAPPAGVKRAALVTHAIDTGPYGDNDTTRTLALLQLAGATAASLPVLPKAVSFTPPPQLFVGLDTAPVTVQRKLYFSEVLVDPTHPDTSPTNFFITVDGATPTLFSPSNPPAITTMQGAVEEWTIENRALESHEFHIHQIHFLLMKRNGLTLSPDQQQYLDTVQVPFWKGSGPYPSVTVLMDFRGKVTGDFVYHCHILGHEDNGMMAIIRVLPKSGGGAQGG